MRVVWPGNSLRLFGGMANRAIAIVYSPHSQTSLLVPSTAKNKSRVHQRPSANDVRYPLVINQFLARTLVGTIDGMAVLINKRYTNCTIPIADSVQSVHYV